MVNLYLLESLELPLSPDQPVNGLIGCFSDDNKYVMATAWDNYQELFQGIFVCIHSGPGIGGLKAGEVKKLRGILYIVKMIRRNYLSVISRIFRQKNNKALLH